MSNEDLKFGRSVGFDVDARLAGEEFIGHTSKPILITCWEMLSQQLFRSDERFDRGPEGE